MENVMTTEDKRSIPKVGENEVKDVRVAYAKPGTTFYEDNEIGVFPYVRFATNDDGSGVLLDVSISRHYFKRQNSEAVEFNDTILVKQYEMDRRGEKIVRMVPKTVFSKKNNKEYTFDVDGAPVIKIPVKGAENGGEAVDKLLARALMEYNKVMRINPDDKKNRNN